MTDDGAGPLVPCLVALAARPRLARKVRLKLDPIEKRFVLLYPERGMKLSESAAAILQRCDGARTVEAIAVELAGATAAPLDAVRADVTAFLGEMAKRGLVTLGEGA